jgi:hypothetical protein
MRPGETTRPTPVERNNEIKTLLSQAGLSGIGLSKLCHKNPPLDPQQVRAVLLFAQARRLGPGYIYRCLERADPVIDELFLQFAALDDKTLGLFWEATREFKINGTMASKIRTPIPKKQIELFVRFVEAFTGIEAASLAAALEGKRAPAEQPEPVETASGKTDPVGVSGLAFRISPGESLDTFWKKVLWHLRLQMTRGTFEAWLKDTRLKAREGSHFTIAAKSDFAKDWLERRLFTTIRRTIINLIKSEDEPALRDLEITFVVDSSIKGSLHNDIDV